MSISNLFQQDVKLVDELMFLLSREQISLVDADINAIEDLLNEKGALIQRISASAKLRYQALAKSGYKANENGMQEWVESQPDTKQRMLWKDFQATLEQAKELNRLNGQLINKHFNRNQQILNQLQGKSVNTNRYGPNGQTSTTSYFRSSLAV
jgi:flagellar biosynthesis protein FlgN